MMKAWDACCMTALNARCCVGRKGRKRGTLDAAWDAINFEDDNRGTVT